MSTIERTTPRLTRNARRPNAEELAALLPPVVSERMADAKELVEHQRVAQHYAELRVRLAELQLAMKAERDAQTAAAAKAIRAGRPAKPSTKVDELERELLDVGGELDTTAALLADTAVALLDASVPYLLDARAAASERREVALDEAAVRLDDAVALIESAGAIASELAWIGRMLARGEASPYGHSRSPAAVDGLRETRHAAAKLAEGRQRQLERAARAKHDEYALNVVTAAGGAPRELPLPPGTEVWTLPRAEPEPDVEPDGSEAAAG